MTNEEAFDINQPFVTQEQKFKYWEESKAEIKRLKAAIAYMQEQSEPVGFIDEADEGIFGDVQNGIAEGLCSVGDVLYTTPQRQQPLKRLSAERLGELTMDWVTDIERTPKKLALAIMDEMERINK